MYRDQVDREPSRSLSDRDAREQDDSFNRSMSNAEGTPDDKIGRFSWNFCFYELERLTNL